MGAVGEGGRGAGKLPGPDGGENKSKFTIEGNTTNINTNKKFWEDLIAYFPLIRHGPHRK
jgi:hypothetical protein